ncbi:alpha/beta hydrolase family protein [Streptomyces microflavus]
MIRGRKAWATAIAVLTVAGVAPAGAYAAPAPPEIPTATAAQNTGNALPPGWRIAGEDGRNHLEWRAPKPVPMGDARVEFRANGELVGVPEPQDDGRTFRLPMDAVRTADLDDLQVQAAGRRLDEAPDAGTSRKAEPPAPKLPPKLPAGTVDPGKAGKYATTTGEYSLSSVRLPGLPAPVEMRGVVVAPKKAPGKRPVALFLHGRHSTCYVPGKSEETSIDWPCAKGSKPIPSHRGYLRDQKLLASQGYVTVSISANGINGQDWNAEDGGAQARSSLIRNHLGRWADWAAKPASAPAAVRKGPKTDLSRVLLVGHSRGGEGVNRAVMDSLYKPPAAQDGYRSKARWNIRGTVHIGPTIFGQNPVPDVPSLTILPGCDGDVSDLQGQVFTDGTRGVSRGKALHSSVYMVGANHNYFNTEWTPGQAKAPADDDFWHEPESPDPLCSPGAAGRLSANQQHKAGATYIAAAARLFVGGDDRVRQLVDGTGRRAPSADPARVLTHAVGGNRGAGFLPDDPQGPLKVSGAKLCDAVAPGRSACMSEKDPGSSPHFAQWRPEHEAGRRAVALDWKKPGTVARVTPKKPLSVKGAKSLALRVAVPPNTSGTRFDVSVKDTKGKRAKLGSVRIDGLPGTDRTTSYWAQEVRVPLTAATRAKLNLGRIAALELTPRSRSGKAWLMDAWSWKPGTPAVKAAPLARVDIGRLTVKEGDAGVITYKVPVRTTGKNAGAVRLYVVDPDTGSSTGRLVEVGPGTAGIDVKVKVVGNKRYGWDKPHDILVKAVRGTVIGADAGGVTAQNDDPMPKVTVEPVAADVTEGAPLTWRISLSEKADIEIWTLAQLVPVPGGRPELSTADVDQEWLSQLVEKVPNPAIPLSKVEYGTLWTTVPAGEQSAELTVPTIRDQVKEPAEYVRLQPTDDEGEPLGPPLEGTVRDAP